MRWRGFAASGLGAASPPRDLATHMHWEAASPPFSGPQGRGDGEHGRRPRAACGGCAGIAADPTNGRDGRTPAAEEGTESLPGRPQAGRGGTTGRPQAARYTPP